MAGALALACGAVLLGCSAEQAPVRITSAQAGQADQSGQVDQSGQAGQPAPGASAAGRGQGATVPVAPPVRLVIPRIGVDAPVAATGLNADGTVEVPPMDRPEQVGWYRNGPAPGETGPAVLLGHLDTRKGPAVFHQLPRLAPGDRVELRREDGSTVAFRVRELVQYPKSRFPTELVYGNTTTAQLRLVTCGGALGGDGHYLDNIIVLADLLP
ncbi:class F sortase [Kitasatospora sp. NPDC049285]|uniref:class F sortase n=1 Tax=Kitasatospora sp. NPDC049285 TaxID=3157096 RepID=UPI003416FCD4